MIINQGNSFCQLIEFTDLERKLAVKALSYADAEKQSKSIYLKKAIAKAHMRKQLRKVGYLSKLLKELGDFDVCLLDKNNKFPSGLLFKVKALYETGQAHEKYSSNLPGLTVVDNRIQPDPYQLFRWKNVPPTLRPYQKECLDIASIKHKGTWELAVGCHAKGQGILMHDGSIKKVEDIVVGDKLMGPDSTERTVHTLYNGTDKMVEIQPIKGSSFIVNENHVLSLIKTRRYGQEYKRKYKDGRKRIHNPIINIKVKDYLKLPTSLQADLKLYRTGVEFEQKSLEIPPYIFGLWLGDGNSNSSALTTMDEEIKNEWCEYAKVVGHDIRTKDQLNNKSKIYFITAGRTGGQKSRNKMFNILTSLGVISNKHIPQQYLTGSKEQRLELLAGLIDTDGSLGHSGFDFIQKNKLLSEQVVFLARSLGLAAYIKECQKSCQTGAIGTYWRVNISGNTNIIPTRLKRKQAKQRKQIKNVLYTGFKVKQLDKNEYFGFGVDKDNLYLMDDFTVTHNSGKTLLAANIIKQTGVNTLFVVPSSALAQQTFDVFSLYFGKDKVQQISTKDVKAGKKLKPILISTVQTLASLTKQGIVNKITEHIHSLMLDEAHHASSNSYLKLLPYLDHVYYRFNFSGTYTRNDSKIMELWGVCGEKLYKYNASKATSEGYLSPVEFKIVDIEGVECSDYHDEYTTNYGSKIFLDSVRDQVKQHSGKSILILVDRKDLVGKQIHEWLKVDGIESEYITGDNNKEDTKEAMERFNDKENLILIASQVLGEGADIKSTDVLILARGGKSEIAVTQAIGRAVRLYPGKTKAIVVDYFWHGPKWLGKHTKLRMQTYVDEFDAIF